MLHNLPLSPSHKFYAENVFLFLLSTGHYPQEGISHSAQQRITGLHYKHSPAPCSNSMTQLPHKHAQYLYMTCFLATPCIFPSIHQIIPLFTQQSMSQPLFHGSGNPAGNKTENNPKLVELMGSWRNTINKSQNQHIDVRECGQRRT